MLSIIRYAFQKRVENARNAEELRRFQRAEPREIGVSGEQLEAFLSGRG